MKKYTLTIVFACVATPLFAQKVELGVQINSGLFSFQGTEIKRDAYAFHIGDNMGIGDGQSEGGTSFGGRNGLNIGAGSNIKLVTSARLFFAAELGFDYSKSRVAINKIYWGGAEAAKGKVNLRFTTIYVAPTIGYRFSIQNMNIDLGIGLDLSRLISANEKMTAKSTESEKHLSYTRQQDIYEDKGYGLDLRPHANLKISYNRFGVFCGYSLGTTDYKKGLVGSTKPQYAYSRLWRIGLSYQFS